MHPLWSLLIAAGSTVGAWLVWPGPFAWYMSGMNTATLILVAVTVVHNRRRDELRRQRELREDWRRRF